MILIVLSDIDSSPMHIAIIEKLRSLDEEFQVIILGSRQPYIESLMKKLGIHYFSIPYAGKLKFPRIIVALFQVLHLTKPTTVYASGQFATLFVLPISFCFRVRKRIFTRHHSNLHHQKGMRFWRHLDELSNFLATNVVVVSESLRQFLLHEERVNPKKLLLINNGINLEKFQLKSANKVLDARMGAKETQNAAIKVGVVARITEWKGVIYTAQAFIQFQKSFPNSQLIVVGEQLDAFSEVSKLLMSLPETNYQFIPHISDIDEFMASLDLFIHVPVGPYEEAFGLVYIEALAAGVPSVFTLSGVLHDLEGLENYCEIVPYRNQKAIFEAMMKLSTAPRTSEIDISSDWLENYSMEQMSAQYSKIMQASSS